MIVAPRLEYIYADKLTSIALARGALEMTAGLQNLLIWNLEELDPDRPTSRVTTRHVLKTS